jgi:hypothetical protein
VFTESDVQNLVSSRHNNERNAAIGCDLAARNITTTKIDALGLSVTDLQLMAEPYTPINTPVDFMWYPVSWKGFPNKILIKLYIEPT